MTPERWQRVDELFQVALSLDPSERASYLEHACKGDASLRQEVESLLASHDQAENFIEKPALNVEAEAVANDLDEGASPTPTQVVTDLRQRKPIFFWIALILGTMVLGLYVFAVVLISRYGGLRKDFGWEYAADGHGVNVTSVSAQGAAAGKLQAGDRILAINNESRISSVSPRYVLREISVGSGYTIRVQRDGVEFEFELILPPLTTNSSYFGPALSRFGVSIVFYVLAMLIGILRPNERVAQLACIGSLAGAMTELETVLRPLRDLFQGPEMLTYSFLFAPFNIIIWAIAYHFFYRFPPGLPEGRFWLFLKRLSYSWAATLCLIILSARLAYFTDSRASIAVLFSNFFYLSVLPAIGSFLFVIPFAIFAVILRNYWRIKDPDQRRRMKWVIYGSAAGTVPTITHSILLLILVAIGKRSGPQADVPAGTWLRSLDLISDLAMVIVPITFGYAIIKHRVFDINVVVRRGLQYMLAKNVLRIILALPILAVVYRIISNPNQTVSDIFFHSPIYLILAAAAGISLKYRRPLTQWIDRKFFREAYNQEQILIGLLDQMKELDSMTRIAGLVSRKLDSALHLASIYVFYRGTDTRDLALGYSSGGSSQSLIITVDSQLFRFMESRQSAEEFPFSQIQILPAREQAWLERLGINLIVPVSGTDERLIGLLLLGEKKSEQPYSTNDRRLLEAIARQIAVIYENVLLKQHVDREARIKREVLAHLEEQRINLVKECPACGACFDSAAQVCIADSTELILTLPVERIIDGKYRLDQLLGKGGMGAVYGATDLRLAREVAIKIITGNLFGDLGALRRFEREAKASAKLNHPNIVAIHDYGRTQAEGAYLVMELVPGITLREQLKRFNRLPAAVVADWFNQLLEGVRAAHAAGIIHRDLKPENILIATPEHNRTLIKIVDFGLAKLRMLDNTDPNSLTAPGVMLGTISYMSPEQLSGEDVDERSDIFSLGVMLVEVLTGTRPFSGRTHTEVLTSILHKSYHLKDDTKESLQLSKVLQKCLAKDRQHRYTTVAEMQQELIPAIQAYSLSESVADSQNLRTSFPVR